MCNNKLRNQQGATMQSEEVEEAAASETPMTFSDEKSPSPHPTCDYSSNKLQVTKFEGINLEDDIEKVEVSSRGSSDSVEVEDETRSDGGQVFPGFQDENPSESIKNWLQRITDLQKKLHLEPNSTSNPVCNNNLPVFNDYNIKTVPPQNPSRVVKFQDLPYMGEMTLDNSKPRRGRKPKKADICHLIYKNYGTIFPGTPNAKSYTAKDKHKGDSSGSKEDLSSKSDVQNRIISSLLEKRLTQDIRSKGKCDAGLDIQKIDQNEPLNLCIRDLNHLKIRLLSSNKKLEDVSSSALTGDFKSELNSDDDVEFINETPSPSSMFLNEPQFPPVLPPESLGLLTPPEGAKPGAAPGGYVYWPNAGVFIHPMALQQHLMYYQRMAANSNYTLPSHSPRPPPETPPCEAPDVLRKLVPKTSRSKKSDHSSEETEPSVEQKTKRNASSVTGDKTPIKRKRSAIFIPPIPTENNTNPATEVSICKFKFTGGAKPSLQEKKMLSVDSGGNFRYYSGTGDKSMRGYEFFPRETLQQQITSTQGSSTGAFLQAAGEKIYHVPPSAVDFTGNKANADFLMAPDNRPAKSSPDLNVNAGSRSHQHKKRKSRKSLQREKLEQTFKEKGFLIQTQQLESAEGATYCKFRQLRKFTRYLFRSWKDYLPGNVRELQEGERMDNEDVVAAAEQDIDSLPRHPSELNNVNL